MPVLRAGGFRFYFYMNEGSEPAHIHVESGDGEAKLWLEPIAVAYNRGYASHELSRIETLIREHLKDLLNAWKRVHDR